MTDSKIVLSNAVDSEMIDRLYAWSLEAYGPGMRTKGILDHIRKELKEIEDDPEDMEEWIDVILLALNGAQRLNKGGQAILDQLFKKIVKNEFREWPDWRTHDPDKAIEHVKSPVETTAQKLYEQHTDNHPTIHSNRFPAWSELTQQERDQWIAKLHQAVW